MIFKIKINPHHEGRKHASEQNEVKDRFLSEAQTCTRQSSHSGGDAVLLCFYVKCLWMALCYLKVCSLTTCVLVQVYLPQG